MYPQIFIRNAFILKSTRRISLLMAKNADTRNCAVYVQTNQAQLWQKATRRLIKVNDTFGRGESDVQGK